MKRILACVNALLLLLTSQSILAAPGMMFNVTASGATLSITTTIPNHTYPHAGIMVNTAGYTLKNPGTECTVDASGYCLFPASNTQPTTITIAGPAGKLSVILCLDGTSRLSCQHSDNISFQPIVAAKKIYVANDISGSSVILCNVAPTTGLIDSSSCHDAGGDSVLDGTYPQGIALNNAGTMAYMTGSHYSSPFITQCAIDSANGSFTSCTNVTVTSPTGYEPYYGLISLNSTNTFAYVVDYNSGSTGRVLACPIASGSLSGSCVDTGATGVTAYGNGVTLNKAGTMAYLTSYDGALIVCNVVSGTTFNNCIAKTGGGGSSPIAFDGASSTALNATEDIIYVTNYYGGTVYGCSTTPNNSSLFDSCFIASPTISDAWVIALNQANTVAYITDYGANVFSCPIQDNGAFGTCTANSGFTESVGLALGY